MFNFKCTVVFALLFVQFDSAPTPEDCSRKDVDFWGADIGYKTAENLKSCRKFCKEKTACVSLTFRFVRIHVLLSCSASLLMDIMFKDSNSNEQLKLPVPL
jgi:hypothetical protein